jgi:hypothetical protein
VSHFKGTSLDLDREPPGVLMGELLLGAVPVLLRRAGVGALRDEKGTLADQVVQDPLLRTIVHGRSGSVGELSICGRSLALRHRDDYASPSTPDVVVLVANRLTVGSRDRSHGCAHIRAGLRHSHGIRRAAVLSVGVVGGAQLGAHISLRLRGPVIQWLLAASLFALAAKLLQAA